MRLYKVSAQLPPDGHMSVAWLGTQSECASRRAELQRKHGIKRDDIVTDEVEVPTTKKELLEWLNTNAA